MNQWEQTSLLDLAPLPPEESLEPVRRSPPPPPPPPEACEVFPAGSQAILGEDMVTVEEDKGVTVRIRSMGSSTDVPRGHLRPATAEEIAARMERDKVWMRELTAMRLTQSPKVDCFQCRHCLLGATESLYTCGVGAFPGPCSRRGPYGLVVGCGKFEEFFDAEH